MDTSIKARKIEEPKNPYTDEWLDHKFGCFLKIGFCEKSGDVDFILNWEAYQQMSKAAKEETGRVLRGLIRSRFGAVEVK